MKNKKGAVELSMSVIILGIIGVIILVLAVPWIIRTVTKTTKLTDTAFEYAKLQLEDRLGEGRRVSIEPDRLTLADGDKPASVSIGCYNDGENLFTGPDVDYGNPSGVDIEKSGGLPSVSVGSHVFWVLKVTPKSSVSQEVVNIGVTCSDKGAENVPLMINY